MNREHLYRLLGYRFRDAALLEQAMTHRSAGSTHYERMEFLGDSLLNFLVAQSLYERLPEASEGDLTRMRAALVREETLGAVAADLGLAEFVQLGGSALKSGVYRRRSVLADTVEALIGAVLLDADVATARECVQRWWGQRLIDLPEADSLKDPKTRLQEWLQGRSRPRPEYEVLEVSGPAHRQHFRVCCRLADGEELVEGSGASRRGAEQNAARAMLEKLDA